MRSDIPVFVGSVRNRKRAVRWCAIKPKPAAVPRAGVRRNQTLLTLHSLNMLHSGFWQKVFGILARHNISGRSDYHFGGERRADAGYYRLHLHGRYVTGQSLIDGLSALCRVEVEEKDWRWSR